MVRGIGSGLLLPAALALWAVAAEAAPLPADCSSAPIPAGPARGEIAGVVFGPTSARLRLSQKTTFGDLNFDDWELTLTGHDVDGDDMELEITAMIPAGKSVDGRGFRQLSFEGGDAFDNMDKQPIAAEGAPEIQGWTISYAARGLSESNVFNPASLHLIYGKRSGTSLPGQIYFCAPKVKGSFLAGNFTVDLGQQ
jgi:hypothetical protein